MADNHLSADAAWLFPEYDFDTMDLECHKSVIIERVLERGTWEQLRWLFVTYGEASVAEWVWRHGFWLLSRRSFALWRLAPRGNGLRCTRVGSGGQEDGAMVDFYELTTTPACRHAQAIDAGKVGGCTCLLRSGRPPADAPFERVGRLNGIMKG